MRIGYNAQILSSVDAGVANFARHLLLHLIQLPTSDEFLVFGNPSYLAGLSIPHGRIVPTHSFVRTNRRRILWEQFVLPRKCGRCAIELMLYPDHTSAVAPAADRTIITIHDLAFLAIPEVFPRATRLYKSIAVKYSAQRATRILVGSQSTKEACFRYLGLGDSIVRVVHHAIEDSFHPIIEKSRLDHVRQRLSLDKNFLLFVGTLEPRKNLIRLLHGYALARSRKKIDHQLVIVGQEGWLFTDIYETVRKLSIGVNVKFLGYVDRVDLIALYNLADALVYPSLYEGFGRPPLEAMACGCPVLTSDRSSLREIAGEAALFVDPFSVEEIGDGIVRIVSDMAFRERLRSMGFTRAGMFRWEKTALKVMDVINEVREEST